MNPTKPKRKRTNAIIVGSSSLVSIPRCTCGRICERDQPCSSCGKINCLPKRTKDDRYISEREFGQISRIAGI
jgi:hypothetical protein